jgi:hypothetical protein
MTGTNCDLFTHNQSRSYLNHLVLRSTPEGRARQRKSAGKRLRCSRELHGMLYSSATFYLLREFYLNTPRVFLHPFISNCAVKNCEEY